MKRALWFVVAVFAFGGCGDETKPAVEEGKSHVGSGGDIDSLGKADGGDGCVEVSPRCNAWYRDGECDIQHGCRCDFIDCGEAPPSVDACEETRNARCTRWHGDGECDIARGCLCDFEDCGGGPGDTGGGGDGGALDSGAVVTGGLVPEFGAGTPTLTVVGSAQHGFLKPRDVAFHPSRDEAWVVDEGFEGVVLFTNPGAERQRAERLADAFRAHFMAKVSSIAFGDDDDFATCHQSRNEYGAPNARDFMGPTLWDSDRDIFARVNQDIRGPLGGSHIDMLHQSPLCLGIAHAGERAFWAVDGLRGIVTWYDFNEDHGPGYDDHSDGQVRRYPEVALTPIMGISAHIVADPDSKWVYVADTGAGRVLRFNGASGRLGRTLPLVNEPLAEFSEWTGVDVEVFVSGLNKPSGISIQDDRVFVGEFGSGDIVAFDKDMATELGRLSPGLPGTMGVEHDRDGGLWFVNAVERLLVRVDP